MSQPIGRRELFTRAFGLLRGTEDSSGSRRLPDGVLRPPGAVSEGELRRLCTSCGLCVAACPHEAIRLLGPEAGELQGTPAVIPKQQPCQWCVDFPCVQACPEGALRPELVKRGMGVARVVAGRCLLAQGMWCDECVQKCPLSGRAIRLEPGFRVTVDGSVCVGCGVCEFVCPVSPPAVRVRPLAESQSLVRTGTV